MNFEDALNEVLQWPRYDRLTGRSTDISEIATEWIANLLDWIFDRLDFAFPDGSGININTVAAIFAIVGGIVALVAGFILVRSFLRSRVPQQHDLSDIFEELARHNYTVSELIELSQRASDRRIAVRYRYIATLLALNEKQTIQIEPSATNAIIMRQVQTAAPQLATHFTMVANIFHLAWFGHKDIHDEAFQEFISAVDMLVSSQKEV